MPTNDSLKAPDPSDRLLTLAGVCDRTGFTLPYVEAMVEAGEFGAIIAGEHEGPLVPAAAVDNWMAAHGRHRPHTEEDKALLAAFTPAEFFDEPKLTQEKKAARMKEIGRDRARSTVVRAQMLAERRRRSD